MPDADALYQRYLDLHAAFRQRRAECEAAPSFAAGMDRTAIMLAARDEADAAYADYLVSFVGPDGRARMRESCERDLSYMGSFDADRNRESGIRLAALDRFDAMHRRAA